MPERDRVRVYTIFFDIDPSEDDTHIVPMSNDEIVHQLEKDCPNVDFAVRDLTNWSSPEFTTNLGRVLNEIQDLKRLDYDGVIVYGWPRDYGVLRSGLPTINISIINDFMSHPIRIYHENKVVVAFLDPWKFCNSEEITNAMYRDLIEKIRLIEALRKFRGAIILSVIESPFFNVLCGDVLKNPPENYNERFLDAIYDVFGAKVNKIGGEEVWNDIDIQNLWLSESNNANDIADMWISDAVKVINTIRSEVVKSAKCYLAMKVLMEKYDASALAFHMESLSKDPKPEDHVHPALATSEFQKNGIVAMCQSHINIVLSEMVLQFAFGRPSMLGDFQVDPYNGTSIVQHCEGPWNPWGDDRRVPYIITDHRERHVRGRKQPGVGAASWVLYPPDETVTIWQLDVLRKEVLVHTGITTPIDTEVSFYKNHFWDMM